MLEGWIFVLVHIYLVYVSKAAVEEGSDAHWNIKAADDASEPGGVTSDRDGVLEGVVLLKAFVQAINGVDGCNNHSQKVLDVLVPAHRAIDASQSFSRDRHANSCLQWA